MYDEITRSQVQALFDGDAKELEDAFYKDLEFGTGGLRGIMGVGTNRMNRYTVGMATQGVANYMRSCFVDQKELKVAIAYDNRKNSYEFAFTVARIFSANGFTVHIFESLRPTPELSFAIRDLKCQGGVMITASHNPKEYNGYKLYWDDGAQVVNPHDVNVIEEVRKIEDISMVKFGREGDMTNIFLLGKKMDRKYLSAIRSMSFSYFSIKKHWDLSIVYSPLHGAGVNLVPMALKQLGFRNIFSVPEQSVIDGDFSAVASPNPEDPSAYTMAIEYAKERDAEIVLVTDPDADRMGVAVRKNKGEYVLLNGNQIASLLIYYTLDKWLPWRNPEKKPQYIVKTIVTTRLIEKIAEDFEVELYNVLTGFKYIAELVQKFEGEKVFIAGAEESYGFNAGEFVRDKDAVLACCLMAECVAWLKDLYSDPLRMLETMYNRYGLYKESQISRTFEGVEGVKKIASMMRAYRLHPPREMAGERVVKIIDYLDTEKTGLPASDVLQLFTEDESVITIRPSGTEPKIKFYFGVKNGDVDAKLKRLEREF